MRALIVVDIPNDLDVDECFANCQIYHITRHTKYVKSYKKVQDVEYAEIKPLPNKLDANDWHRMFDGEYKIREAKGFCYNKCVSEIIGEDE